MLDEVLYWLHATGDIPVWAAVRPALDGEATVLVLALPARAEITGSGLAAGADRLSGLTRHSGDHGDGQYDLHVELAFSRQASCRDQGRVSPARAGPRP